LEAEKDPGCPAHTRVKPRSLSATTVSKADLQAQEWRSVFLPDSLAGDRWAIVWNAFMNAFVTRTLQLIYGNFVELIVIAADRVTFQTVVDVV
jgi:hypothetical protein